MVMIDQVCWHEMDVDGSLTLQTESPFCRGIETGLRRTLYQWKHMRVDMVVEPTIQISKVIRNTGYGIEIEEERAITDPDNDIVGHLYIDQLTTEEDLQKIRPPELELDAAATAEAEETARGIFDGLLAVQMQGCCRWPIWDIIAQWTRRAEHPLGPGGPPRVHAPGHETAHRCLPGHARPIGGEGPAGLCADRPSTAPARTPTSFPPPASIRTARAPRDLWTAGMAQIFSTVSPAMHQEFELDYVNRFYERFGLVYYGCCEPLHNKVDIIKRIPHVRKVSMSPWVDMDKGAQRIGKDLVFSRKPSPAFLAGPTWNPEVARKDLQDTRDACDRYGTPLEFILKDISTVAYQPQRLWEWAEVAMRVAKQ